GPQAPASHGAGWSPPGPHAHDLSSPVLRWCAAASRVRGQNGHPRIAAAMPAVYEARSTSLAVRAVGGAFPAAGAPGAVWPVGTWAGGASGGELFMVVLPCLGSGGGGR